MGGTLKNTVVTITGQNLENVASILIDDIECTIVSGSNTASEVQCATGDKVGDALLVASTYVNGSNIKIRSDKGYTAMNAVKFDYIDRWSDKNTWGGLEPPIEGESVNITPGLKILLDVSPPRLYLLIVEGELRFDNIDITLDVDYFLVRDGVFRVGSEEEP
mmetsp:Transcript_2079/g.4170  ORF Transcript_2079/g.4170 Transcript_2079/m.4170 type:complete len:162 (+) Transcript_2079:1264-1749(+)